MIPASALRTLRDALGPEAVREDEGARVDGEPLAPTLRPAGAEALAAALRALGSLSLACVVRGGGSRLDFGNPPRGASLLLSTALLTGVESRQFRTMPTSMPARPDTSRAARCTSGHQRPINCSRDGTRTSTSGRRSTNRTGD